MRWNRFGGSGRGTRRAAECLAVVLAALVPVAASADVASPACQAELADLDRGFVQSMARLLQAGSPVEQCVALTAHINEVAKAVETQLRCRVPGGDLDKVVAMLTASGDNFRQLQSQLGCNVPA